MCTGDDVVALVASVFGLFEHVVLVLEAGTCIDETTEL